MDWTQILLEAGFDIPLENSQFLIKCPFHGDTHASCSINVDKGMWICFRGCGQGSLRSFIQRFFGFDDPALSKYLDEREFSFDLNMFDEELPLEVGDLLEVESPFKHGYVPEWIFDRGFTKKALKRWNCGIDSNNNLIIPIKDRESRLVGWVTRQYNREPKYLYSKGLKKSRVLFGEFNIEPCSFVCITEGTLDTMWLDQHGYNSVAILGANMSFSQQEAVLKLPTDELVLCLDNDDAGRIGTDRIMSCIAKRFVVSYVQLPNGYKDVQDIRDETVLDEIIAERTFW
jgi:DNA primase